MDFDEEICNWLKQDSNDIEKIYQSLDIKNRIDKGGYRDAITYLAHVQHSCSVMQSKQKYIISLT